MKDIEKSITDGTLTEKEIIHLLLHNAQHMATREEVKSDIKDLKVDLKEDISKIEISLKQDILKLDDKISKVETTLKQENQDLKAELKQDNQDLKAELKQDNQDLSKRIDRFMFWSLGLTITSTFLILGLIYKTIP